MLPLRRLQKKYNPIEEWGPTHWQVLIVLDGLMTSPEWAVDGERGPLVRERMTHLLREERVQLRSEVVDGTYLDVLDDMAVALVILIWTPDEGDPVLQAITDTGKRLLAALRSSPHRSLSAFDPGIFLQGERLRARVAATTPRAPHRPRCPTSLELPHLDATLLRTSDAHLDVEVGPVRFCFARDEELETWACVAMSTISAGQNISPSWLSAAQRIAEQAVRQQEDGLDLYRCGGEDGCGKLFQRSRFPKDTAGAFAEPDDVECGPVHRFVFGTHTIDL